jgi:hypothetical protein
VISLVTLALLQGLLGLFELALDRLQEFLLPLHDITFLLGEHADGVSCLLLGNSREMVVDSSLPSLSDLIAEAIEFVGCVLLL